MGMYMTLELGINLVIWTGLERRSMFVMTARMRNGMRIWMWNKTRVENLNGDFDWDGDLEEDWNLDWGMNGIGLDIHWGLMM